MINDIYILQNKFKCIKDMGWIRSLRKGATGIGYTFETLLGKKEDSFSNPDFNEIEIKTHRAYSKAYITLFNYNPIGETSYELKRIFDKYGYNSTKYKNFKVLNAYAYCGYINDVGIQYKFSLRVDENNGKVYLLVFDRLGNFIEKSSYWSINELKKKIYNKMKYLAYVEASSKYVDNCEYLRYDKIYFYKLKDFDTFINLLKDGKIRVSFLVSSATSEKDYLIKTHGTAFSIKPCNLNLLYDLIREVS